MKRLLSFLLTGALLMTTLAGCSGSSKQPSNAASAGSTASTAAKTKVVFWHSMSGSMQDSLKEVVNNYNQSQSKVEVVLAFQGNYYDMAAKLQTAVTSGNTPHIAQLEMGRTKMFQSYGILQDMTSLAKQTGIDKNKFYKGLMSSCDWGQGLYALPFNRSTPMFYYNMDMFKEIGLDPNKPPQTWDDLQQYAKKLSIPGKRWGFEMPIDEWFYEAFIMQSNGTILNSDETDIGFNNDSGVKPLELWKTMIRQGFMKQPPGKEYNSFEAARSDFAAKVSGMIVGSSGDLNTLTKSCKFKIGTCFLPKNTRFGVPTGGANVVMLKGHDQDSAAAIDFLKYLTSPDTSAKWASQTGYLPSGDDAANSQIYKTYIREKENAKTALAQMQYTDIPRPNNPKYPEIANEIAMTEIQRCIEKADYTPEQAVAEISKQVKNLLSKK